MAVLRALIRPLAALAALGLFLAGTARVLLDQTTLRDRLRPAAEALLDGLTLPAVPVLTCLSWLATLRLAWDVTTTGGDGQDYRG